MDRELRRGRPRPDEPDRAAGPWGQPFSAPSVVDVMRLWKMKNTHGDGDGHQHRGGQLQGELVAGPELTRDERADTGGEGVQFGALPGNDEDSRRVHEQGRIMPK